VHRKVSVFVNDSATPSLVVTELTSRRGGPIGLWVGNGSDGRGGELLGHRLNSENGLGRGGDGAIHVRHPVRGSLDDLSIFHHCDRCARDALLGDLRFHHLVHRVGPAAGTERQHGREQSEPAEDNPIGRDAMAVGFGGRKKMHS
ncbi:MAG: hypothetical protein ABIZ49_05610, partial [Opitutaceae bacterium]